jgi:hypothetical protein
LPFCPCGSKVEMSPFGKVEMSLSFQLESTEFQPVSQS